MALNPYVALDQVTADAISKRLAVESIGNHVRHAVNSRFSMQVVLTGSPTGGTVELQGSLDGENFDAANPLAAFIIGTDASGEIKFTSDKAVAFYRVVLADLAGGTDPTVTAIVGVDRPG